MVYQGGRYAAIYPPDAGHVLLHELIEIFELWYLRGESNPEPTD